MIGRNCIMWHYVSFVDAVPIEYLSLSHYTIKGGLQHHSHFEQKTGELGTQNKSLRCIILKWIPYKWIHVLIKPLRSIFTQVNNRMNRVNPGVYITLKWIVSASSCCLSSQGPIILFSGIVSCTYAHESFSFTWIMLDRYHAWLVKCECNWMCV